MRYTVNVMHLSLFSPRVGVAGIPWGLDFQIIVPNHGHLTEKFYTWMYVGWGGGGGAGVQILMPV